MTKTRWCILTALSFKHKRNTNWVKTHPAAPTSCHTHPGQNAWRFSDWASCFESERGCDLAFQQRYEGSSSSRRPRPSLWPGRQRKPPLLPLACTWRNARTLYWSGRPALACGTWLIQTPEEDQNGMDQNKAQILYKTIHDKILLNSHTAPMC